MDFFENVHDCYGVEDTPLSSLQEASDGIIVPDVSVNHTEEQFQELQQAVNPLSDCNDYGVSAYMRTLEIVKSWSREV